MAISHPLKADSPDPLGEILLKKETDDKKQQRIADLCYDRFLIGSGGEQLSASMVDSLLKYSISGHEELQAFIKILSLRRKAEFKKAARLLDEAIEMAQLHDEQIFLYQFYLNQAYVQTDMGNSLNAVFSYRQARKVAEALGNTDFKLTTDIGVSDIYMHIGLYTQALRYLNQAQLSYTQHNYKSASTQKLIYLNKAEVYFKMGALDTLKRYLNLAKKITGPTVRPDRDIMRLEYFALMLDKKYDLAAPKIEYLLATGNQYYKGLDSLYLAKCYYQAGRLDTAFSLASQLAENEYLVSPQIRIDAYKLLASIALDKNQASKANYYLKLALEESEDYRHGITKIADLASELRLDRMESGYTARDLIYRKEKIILVLLVILALLTIVVIFVSYTKTRQKNHYQKLVNQARSEELAFINSHQVRKPLANIIGICSLLESEGQPADELKQYLEYVHEEAKQMDGWLKEVEKKLKH
ncbi:hypothetical protein LPB86_15575 [Pedobacter sp. MC2016-14]|uniref:histidine kinase dimerization/phospho-acceptor domain-containing protein n=1 Tax=Pedobacter sp. MC2016-14 TaxID=2897327 RepID=UPI001E50B9D3|nr:histidine kinase dimerization/phospho-acceptor domain-containing protein [Pedobacter sp. MC2016-14]MCD0489662.1 hypothetical protein [Pedobacter sp. MC2016-14]